MHRNLQLISLNKPYNKLKKNNKEQVVHLQLTVMINSLSHFIYDLKLLIRIIVKL